MKDIFELIIDNLKSEPFFADFKFRKRDSRFYISNVGVHKSVELQRTISWGMFLDIYPVYLVRFDVLEKWFEKFSFKTLRDQRDNATICISGVTFGQKDRFAFERGNSHNNEEYELLRDTVISCAGKVLIKNEDGTYTIVEDKLRSTIPYTDGQKAARSHVEKGNGMFEVRSGLSSIKNKKRG